LADASRKQGGRSRVFQCMTPFKTLALAAGTRCLLSCGAFGPQAQIDVLIPPPPSHWTQAFPDLAFRLVFPDAAGREQEVRVPDPAKPVTINCSKTGNTPILAYPFCARDEEGEMGRAGILRPAGGMYPGSLDESSPQPTLALDWRDGAVATVLCRLISLGRDTSLINAARLARYFREAGDPWKLDLQRIEEELARGEFTAYDIDVLPCRDVYVNAGAGEWFMESPFATVTTLTREGTLSLTGVSLGMHGLFSVEGHLTLINVSGTEIVVMPVR
jgi:hypothetical protein